MNITKFVDPRGRETILRLPPGRHNIPARIIQVEVFYVRGKPAVKTTFELEQSYIDDMRAQMRARGEL